VVSIKCENGVQTKKALDDIRADEAFMADMNQTDALGEIVSHFSGRRL